MSLRRRPVPRPARPPPLPQILRPLHSPDLEKPHFVDATNNHPKSERAILLVLTVAAIATRFFRIHQPNAVVFDELHFAAFLENHLRREFAFDIHPWLGKLTLAFFAWLGGYRAEGMHFEVGNVYKNNDYLFARIPSALFGSACIPLMYLICRELQLSISSSVLGAALPLFDNLLITESRLILLDSQLICYLKLTLFCALRLWRTAEAGKIATKRYYVYLVSTALSGTAAFSVKWTAAVTPFLVVLVCGLGVWFLSKPTPLLHCAVAGALGLAFYVIPWYIHLRVSTTSTLMAIRMGDRFRSTLHGNATFPYNPLHDVTLAESLYELHWRQFRANQKVKTRHKWESKWYEWPLNLRGIYFFVDKADGYTDERPLVRVIYLLQNPAGAIWVFAGVVTFVILLPCIHRYRTTIPKEHRVHDILNRGTFLLAGYLLNLLPYMFVERCCFLYHYLPSLTYGQLLTAMLVDALPKFVLLPVTAIMIASILAAFVFWAPWIYALPLDDSGIVRRQWLPRWN